MASMGLKINSGSGIDLSNADLLAKAIFGDPDQAMRLKRLESDLVTADLTRGQIASHTAYNQALKARQDWELAGMEGGVAPMARIAYDRQQQLLGNGGVATVNGGGGGGGGGGAVYDLPVPVEANVPIPAVRPIDSILAPGQLVQPDIQSLDSMPVPIQLGPEPDYSFSTYPLRSDPVLPDYTTGRQPRAAPPFQLNPLLNGPPTNVVDAPITSMPDLLTGVPPALTPEGQASVPMAPPVVGGVPPELTQERQMGGLPMPTALEGVPPALTQERQIDRSVNVPMPRQLSGLPQEFGPEGSRYTQGPPGSNFMRAFEKARAASSPEDQGFIANLMETLGLGPEVQPAAVAPDIGASLELPTPTPWTQPSGPPLPDIGAGLELPGPQQQPAFVGTGRPDLGGSLSLNENDPLRAGQGGGPDVGAGLDYTAQPPVPVDTSFPPVQGLDLPIDPTAGIPYPGDPRLEGVPPNLQHIPLDRGTVTTIPGRTDLTMPAPDVADMPVPVGEPYRAEGQPYQGPNVPPPEVAQPEMADPHLNVQPVHPKDVETVAAEVQRQTGGQLKGLTYEDYEGLARMAIANGGDVAGTFQKLMGTAGLTYGDFSDPASGDKLRQTIILATGQPAGTTDVGGINDTSGQTVAANADIAKANAAPGALKAGITSDQFGDRRVVPDGKGGVKIEWIGGGIRNDAKTEVIKNIPYQVKTDPEGNVHYKIADGFTAPDAPPFDETSHDGVLLNTMVLYNQKKNRGEPTTPTEDMAYNAAYYEKFHPTTSTVDRPDGRQDTITNFKEPPSDFRVPTGQGAPAAAPAAPAGPGGLGGVPPDLAGPAQPQTATAAADAAANPPAVQGKPLTVRVVAGPNAGKDMPVKNNGGWTAPGEKPPVETNTITGPAGTTTHMVTGDVKERQVTESAAKGYELTLEAIPAAAKLNEYGPGGKPVPSNFATTMAKWDRNYVSGDLIDGIVDQDTREYLRAILAFINMPKRVESGAAVNLDEVRDYITKYTMAPGSNNVNEYLSAKAQRNQQLRAQRLRLASELKSGDLQTLDSELGRYGLDIDWTPPTAAELAAARAEVKKREWTINNKGERVPVEDN